MKVPIHPPGNGSFTVDNRNYHSLTERKDAIQNANTNREGYYVVRSIQQSYASHLPAIKHHFHQYNTCEACPLGRCPFVQGKVYYRGYLPADVLFIGKAPGKNEDTLARPFISESGKIFDSIIIDVSKRLTVKVDQRGNEIKGSVKDNAFRWCITPSVLCLPYDYGEVRSPTMEEVKACNHRLLQFINIACPSVVVTSGSIAEKAWNLICKNGTPKLGWSPDLIDIDQSTYGHDSFTPIHVHIEDPEWMLKNPKDLALNMKKAVLKIHAVLKPLFEIGD